jgi:hypothetical protein
MVKKRIPSRTDTAYSRLRSISGLPRIVVWLAGLLTAIVIFKLYVWGSSPERRIQQFAAYANKSNWAGMLSLANPEEIERLGLTPDEFGAILREAACEGATLRLTFVRWDPLTENQARYNRFGEFTLSCSDIRADLGDNPRKVIIPAYTTDNGWKIGPSKFIYLLLWSRYRSNPRLLRHRYREILLRHNATPWIYQPENNTWSDLRGEQPGR